MPSPDKFPRLLATALVVFILALIALPAQAARVDEVEKGSYYAPLFKVEAKKEEGGIRVSVTVPKNVDEYDLSFVSLQFNDKTKVSTNGTSLEFLIDEADFAKAVVFAGYYDDTHKVEGVGDAWAFSLNISSLCGEVK